MNLRKCLAEYIRISPNTLGSSPNAFESRRRHSNHQGVFSAEYTRISFSYKNCVSFTKNSKGVYSASPNTLESEVLGSTCPSTRLRPSVRPSTHPSARLSTRPSARPPARPSVPRPRAVCMPACPSFTPTPRPSLWIFWKLGKPDFGKSGNPQFWNENQNFGTWTSRNLESKKHKN